MKKFLYLSVVCIFAFTSISCATICHGTSTTISINSVPSGARAIVGGTQVITPATITLKNKETYQILFKKDGYEDAYFGLRREMSGWIWGNILIGGLIGLGIDIMTGGAYKIAPTDVNVTLAPLTQPVTQPVQAVTQPCPPVAQPAKK